MLRLWLSVQTSAIRRIAIASAHLGRRPATCAARPGAHSGCGPRHRWTRCRLHRHGRAVNASWRWGTTGVSARDPLLRRLGTFHGKRGWGVRGVRRRPGPVTTIGLGQEADGSYVPTTSEGTVVPGPLLAIGNTTSRVDFGIDPGLWVDRGSESAVGHHRALSLGHVATVGTSVEAASADRRHRPRPRIHRGADDGNRTRVASLEDWGSTIELRPHWSRLVSSPDRGTQGTGCRRASRAPGSPARAAAGRARGVAQVGSASALGAEGRGFESRHPDTFSTDEPRSGSRDRRPADHTLAVCSTCGSRARHT